MRVLRSQSWARLVNLRHSTRWYSSQLHKCHRALAFCKCGLLSKKRVTYFGFEPSSQWISIETRPILSTRQANWELAKAIKPKAMHVAQTLTLVSILVTIEAEFKLIARFWFNALQAKRKRGSDFANWCCYTKPTWSEPIWWLDWTSLMPFTQLVQKRSLAKAKKSSFKSLDWMILNRKLATKWQFSWVASIIKLNVSYIQTADCAAIYDIWNIQVLG